MTTERDIQNAIRIAATAAGSRLFRNNVGVLLDQRGQRIAYGLCHGSSDLIGWTPRVIGGIPVAVFTAIEVKKPGGRLEPHQRQFIEQVLAAGGIAGRATSEAEAVALLTKQ
jgi:hypothetical protein